MSARKKIQPKRHSHNGFISLFAVQNEISLENELTPSLVRSAKRTGQLNLSARGLGKVPDQVWKLNEMEIEKDIDFDFNRSSSEKPWWHSVPLTYLDISSNAIVELPSEINNLPDLTTLLLQDNALASIPPQIGELLMLATLNISRNKLTTLPNEFYKLIELRILNLSYNSLDSLDPAIGDFVMLNKLDLSHNNLTDLPAGMGFMVRLTEIDLSHNKLTELPPDIVNLRDLLKFDLTENELTCLPPLGELRRMVTLHCNHNNITILPDFYGCEALKEIHMANNFIKEITEDFCEQVQNLKVLNLRDNKIEKLPDNVELLQNLIRFDITNNNLSALPSNLGLLCHLQNLQLKGNKLTQSVMAGSGTGKVLKHLRDKVIPDEAELEATREVKWPDKYEMRKNQKLMICAKDLVTIPNEVFEIAATENVNTIDIGKNKIKDFPMSIVCNSDNLTQLILCNNQLSIIPPELGRCVKIQYLELSKNLISDLPIELGSLKHLREIVISYNKFTKIPRCVYDMTNLEIFLAAENQITEINVSSDALAKLKHLAVLDLTNNDVSSVPPELGNFTQIRSLELFGNPFRNPRHAILQKGTCTILSYLRDKIPA